MPVPRTAVAAALRSWRFVHRYGLWDLAVMGAAFALYYWVRGLVEGRATEAFSRSIGIAQVERALGLFWEKELQALVMSSRFLVEAANAIYVYAHFPLIVAVGLWLFFWHRPVYALYRNAFLISGGIGLVFFTFLPTAPPRLLPWPYGLVDTMAALSPINYSMQPAGFVNQYAALPSLHFGWNLLLSLAVLTAARGRLLKGLAMTMPVFMGMAIVATANHYILDLALGAGVALLALALAQAWARHGRRLLPWGRSRKAAGTAS
jgi:hypothetical protein